MAALQRDTSSSVSRSSSEGGEGEEAVVGFASAVAPIPASCSSSLFSSPRCPSPLACFSAWRPPLTYLVASASKGTAADDATPVRLPNGPTRPVMGWPGSLAETEDVRMVRASLPPRVLGDSPRRVTCVLDSCAQRRRTAPVWKLLHL
eukprot:GHVU01005571.1.p2 GENE.GHVU01005571.1~~GHVU01005571.1.p2  ORF type:complete len:148 (-),score=13.41 GHVU01005571.1:508-951(-)